MSIKDALESAVDFAWLVETAEKVSNSVGTTVAVIDILKYAYIPESQIERWITTKDGVHIPIRKGETTAQAIGNRGREQVARSVRAKDPKAAMMRTGGFTNVTQLKVKKGKPVEIYIVRLEDGSKAVWKTKKGMFPRFLRDKLPGREEAGYIVDKMLDLRVVPPSAVRTFQGEEGYVEAFAGKLDTKMFKTWREALGKIDDDSLSRAALFDYVTNQRDRYIGNLRLSPISGGKLSVQLIDNAEGWGDEKNRLRAFSILKEWERRDIDISPSVKNRIGNISRSLWDERLGNLISEEEKDKTWKRLKNVEKLGLKAITEKPLENWGGGR